MFSGFKYRMAKNLVLLEMERDGHVDADTRKMMSEIMAGAANSRFGRQLISTGVAQDKYSAAAVVFARLAAFEMHKPKNLVSLPLWVQAARSAMKHAGASSEESINIVAALMEQQERDNNLA